MAKDNWMSIKIDTPLKDRVKKLAQKEHRTIADQVVYLMEKGLKAIETGQKANGKPAA